MKTMFASPAGRIGDVVCPIVNPLVQIEIKDRFPEWRRDASRLEKHYATEVLDAVFCSDLQRAATTARIAFAGRAVPMVPDARLREYDYGDLTQCPTTQIEEEFLRRITEPFPHGESLLMVVQRVGAFLRDAL